MERTFDPPKRRSILPPARELVAIEPHAGAHHVASRVFVAAAVPAVSVFLLHRPDWLPYALLASVLSVYGRRLGSAQRTIVQVEVGAVLIVLLVAGTTISAAGVGLPAMILGATITAGLGTFISDIRQWTPPGALFFVFAFATTASVPLATGGIAAAALVSALSAAFAIAVSRLMSLMDSTVAGPRRPRPAHPIVVAHAVICAVGAAAAGSVAVVLGIDHPYWAVVSAIVPVVGVTTSGQLARAAHRLAGTALGLLVAVPLFSIPMSEIVRLLVLVGLMALTELWIARNYSIALLFLTPFTIGVTMFGSAAVDLSRQIDSRAIATLIGVIMSVILILATHLVRHPRRRGQIMLG